jgi:hypothetical protein
MGDDQEPLKTGGVAHQISNREIIVMMASIIALASAAGVVFGGIRFGVGVFLGGILAFGNYRWLDQSTRAMLVPDAVSSTGLLASKYVLRYVLIGLIVFGIYFSGILPVTSVLVGLGSFSIAVVLVGLRNIFKT